MRAFRFIFIVAIAVVAARATAQPLPVPPGRLATPPIIDGRLDDVAWQHAARVTTFHQVQPGDNLAPSQPTELLIGYDRRALYLAFRAIDTSQDVRATLARRDAIEDDDIVGVYLDTYEDRRGEGQLRTVMRFDVVRTARDDSRVPERLGDIEPLDRSQAARTRTFVFGGKATLGVPPGVQWVINGEPFDPLRVDASPRLDDVEVWRFVNRPFVGRTMLHPVHTHLAPFQVLSRNGRAPLRQEGGWKDTVAIDDGEEVEVVIRWRGYKGRYLLHCHNLEHEDHSMMARIDVV